MLQQKSKYQIHLKSHTGPINVLHVNKEDDASSPVVLQVPPPKPEPMVVDHERGRNKSFGQCGRSFEDQPSIQLSANSFFTSTVCSFLSADTVSSNNTNITELIENSILIEPIQVNQDILVTEIPV